MDVLILLILGAIVVWFVMMYNGLQRLANGVKRAKANIMASMKKRVDLAQRLADIAKSYGEHEKLTQITTGETISSIGDAMAASRSVDQVIGQVSSLAMAYPDLKANGTYQQLMTQLHEIETDLQSRREAYNDAVSEYNSKRSSLPQALFAGSVGFPEAPFYEVDAEGLDVLAEFKTDDGAMLRDGMQRLGRRAAATSAAAGRQIEARFTELRNEHAKRGADGAEPAASLPPAEPAREEGGDADAAERKDPPAPVA